MSDEEESMSEGFSASEEEWKPNKDAKGGESSDDDDSDFEESPIAAVVEAAGVGPSRKKTVEPKARSAAKQNASKKRAGLSLRAKLYNKYRPPPKTVSPPSSGSKNSPSASTSRTNPKNAKTPNESCGKHQHDDDEGSTSDGSIDNYLVNPDELDFQSSFFNADTKVLTGKSSVSPAPEFDCNAGMGNLSDSESDGADNNDSGNFHKEDIKAFDFRDLLENANSLERAKEAIAKRTAADASNKKSGAPSKSLESKVDTMDVYSLLALGEKQNHRSHNEGEDEEDDDEEDDETVAKAAGKKDRASSNKTPSKLSKTKSTRVKRHTKTRPPSTVVAGGDTDDSDFEEVADTSENADTTSNNDTSHIGNLEIHVDLPSRTREKKTQTQLDIENALKRKLNREIRERQLLVHKASLLCLFGRSYVYNRVLNNTQLMQKALKLLPSKNAYPPERGTEIKYYQSLVTWFKSAITLESQNLYPEKQKVGKSRNKLNKKMRKQLLRQIIKKKAKCKQDMIFMFVILLRGMGLQCRLIVNMQPLPLKPLQCDLLSIKLKQDNVDDPSKDSSLKNPNPNENKSQSADGVTDDEPSTSSKIKTEKHKSVKIENEKEDITPSKNKTESTLKISQDKVRPVVNDERVVLKRKAKKTKDDINSASSDLSEKKFSPSSTVQNQILSSSNMEEISNKKQTRSKILESQKIEREKKYIIEAATKEEKGNTASNDNKKKGRNVKTSNAVKSSATSRKEVRVQEQQKSHMEKEDKVESVNSSKAEELDNSQKENVKRPTSNPRLGRLKRNKAAETEETEKHSAKKSHIEAAGSSIIPTIVVKEAKKLPQQVVTEEATTSTRARSTRSRSRSKSPRVQISPKFLETKKYREKFPSIIPKNTNVKNTRREKSPNLATDKIKISAEFLTNPEGKRRVLRSRQKTNEIVDPEATNSGTNLNSIHLQIPQMDGADDEMPKKSKSRKQKLQKKTKNDEDSEEEFEPSPTKRPKLAPTLSKRDRRVISTDDDDKSQASAERGKQKPTAGDMWVEVWSDVEEQWVCVDLFKGKIHCVDTIRKSASSNLAYVFAFQNDLSLKDVTARYCSNWTTVVRKGRIDKDWLDIAIKKYLGRRTRRDIKENDELRRIHEEKPMPTAISDYKNHPFYALERHLLKFEAIYPPDAPALGYIRKEAVYSRDCIHTLHSREIWVKQARVVKLGEKPYKIVKARPKWDRITQTVIKDQPLEIFGYWQTQEYDPPTAENGIVPRNAYGNVELFKPTMLPKKCVHLRLPGLNRVCRKLGIDCANAVVGFDFHQGSCHPTYDGFIVCEEFGDQVTAAWYQDQEEQELKEQQKYEARVYGNWKKLIRGLLIRERLKLKYNF